MIGIRRKLKTVACICLAVAMVSSMSAVATEEKTVAPNTVVNQTEENNIAVDVNTKCSVGKKLELEVTANETGSYEFELCYTAINRHNPIISI